MTSNFFYFIHSMKFMFLVITGYTKNLIGKKLSD